MLTTRLSTIAKSGLMAAVLFGLAAPSQAQAPAARPKLTAWFGVPTPGPISDLDKPTFVTESVNFGMAPARFARERDPSGALAGPKLMADVNTIVGFSRASRAAGEPLWGRISGMPAERRTVEWAVSRLKAAGLADAHIEDYPLERPLWLPKTWELKISGDASFGAGTTDVVLRSAFPVASAVSLTQTLNAPLVFVGRGSPAELANIDLKGKVAVINVKPDVTLFASREKGVAREAIARGAVAAINAVESPGNMQFFDSRYGCGDAPCFLVGGDDGAFLESVIAKAAAAGKSASLKASISLATEMRAGLIAANGVATVPGKSKEIVIVNGHADAWFDGANDNADGLSVLVGLAEHFARSKVKPERTLIFMVSGGHHTGNGPAAFIKAHPEIMANTVLVMNLEHLAQIQVTQAPRLDPATTPYEAGLWAASTIETTKRAGAANTTPYVKELLGKASRDYGVVTTYGASDSVPGDLGSYTRLGVPAVQLISSEVYYHSSGDNPSTISQPGLERAAAFFANFINDVAKAPKDKLVRPGALAAAAGSRAAAED